MRLRFDARIAAGIALFAASLILTWVFGYYLWTNWTLYALMLGTMYVMGGGFLMASESPYLFVITQGAMIGLIILVAQLFWFG